MIKLFSLKQQKKDGEASPKSTNQKKASAAQLRITKGTYFTCSTALNPSEDVQLDLASFGTNPSILSDINELNLPKTCNTEFPDPDDLLTFKLIICPDEGFYRTGRFVFSFKVN